MKETNMEHFRGEIEAACHGIKLKNGEIYMCHGASKCSDCEFRDMYAGLGCQRAIVRWLMSEYKPEPVLTAREKHFVEFVQEGCLARDKDGAISFYKSQRPVKVDVRWRPFNPEIYMPDCGDFPFITWEDEEAWSIERLRELKVKENE